MMTMLRLCPSLLLLTVAAAQQLGPIAPPALLPQDPAPAVLVEPVVHNRLGGGERKAFEQAKTQTQRQRGVHRWRRLA